jgi:hypothetical protein
MAPKSGAEHLKTEVHLPEAEHHDAMAKTKKNQATLFRAMLKEAGLSTDAQSSYAKMADALDHEANLHESHVSHHRGAAEKCEKAAVDAMNKANQLEPTQVSAVAPDHRPTIRPVIRTGGAPLQQPTVDPRLAKIVGGLREEDWNTHELSLH